MNIVTAMRQRLSLFLFLGVMALGLIPCAAAEKETAPDQDALEVSIAIPIGSGEGRGLSYSRLQFPVVITNRSEKPVRIFQERFSWGYDALSFEVTDPDGKLWKIEKGISAWTMNGPGYWILPPHEHLVIEVNLSDTKTWKPFPTVKDFPADITMRAVFETSPTKESKRLSVWTGRVVSKTEKYRLYDPR